MNQIRSDSDENLKDNVIQSETLTFSQATIKNSDR